MLDDLIARGVPYNAVRDDIAPGDLLLLHHAFVPSWYGVQIEAVQHFTGPFAHVAMFDRIRLGDEERVVVYESVTPKVRCVLVSATAEEGFFWVKLNRPIAPIEREAAWLEMGVNEYDKFGAISAGADALPANEDSNPRRWCAKAVALWRRMSGVQLAPPRQAGDPGRYVPTDMALEAANRFNAQIQYVHMA